MYKLQNFLEKYIVFLVCIISIVVLLFISPSSIEISKIDILLSSLITIIVTLIGVLITALTILIAIMNTKSIKKICENDLWDKFIGYFVSPIIMGVLTLVYLIYETIILTGSTVSKINIIVMSTLMIMFLVGIVRVGYILIYLIKVVPKLESHQEDETAIDKEDFSRGMKEHNYRKDCEK